MSRRPTCVPGPGHCTCLAVQHIQLGAIDYAILIVYFAFVLGIGYWLRGRARSSGEFLDEKDDAACRGRAGPSPRRFFAALGCANTTLSGWSWRAEF